MKMYEIIMKLDEIGAFSQAAELQQTLELEVNLDFGARHEDAAIERYQRRINAEVYGQQHRHAVENVETHGKP